ncbi:MAG: hypothetical protein IR153_01045 [Flavobacterium sp.]|nr:hypothetical protein [Flavobacterium sp.]
MINPSAAGWIDKFFLQHHLAEITDRSMKAYYISLRQTGFIYGHITKLPAGVAVDQFGWVKEEVSKIGLLNALFDIYRIFTNNSDHIEFIKLANKFYDSMDASGFNLFKIVFSAKPSANLEEIIDRRVKTNHDIVSKNFSHIITNALLFIDVLAFHKFLEEGKLPEKYLQKTEETIVTLVSIALKTKTVKSQYDNLLIKLFEASFRYSRFSKVTLSNLEDLKLDYFTGELDRYYLVDIAGMALWSDGEIENEEAYFLYELGDLLNVQEIFVAQSVLSTRIFLNAHKSEIPYFNYSNPVKHFYDQTTDTVVTLIKRNRNRLAKEISKSKELVVLLAHSTRRDLDPKEKKKIKKQLLEICKSIPSLTIFLLPGGSLLLPILIKFIPQLLPSAFNENSERE